MTERKGESRNHMKITTMKDEKMSHNNPAFRNSTVTLGMPPEPRDSYLSSNDFMSKSILKQLYIYIQKRLSWFTHELIKLIGFHPITAIRIIPFRIPREFNMFIFKTILHSHAYQNIIWLFCSHLSLSLSCLIWHIVHTTYTYHFLNECHIKPLIHTFPWMLCASIFCRVYIESLIARIK